LGQARSIKGAFGSKGILNSFPQRKHLNLASSGMGNTVNGYWFIVDSKNKVNGRGNLAPTFYTDTKK